jgi:hypothetical protein
VVVVVVGSVQVPLTHVCGDVHVPQLSVPPQPLLTDPQFLPISAQVLGVQPHTFATPPPPHVFGEVQDPQFKVPPQPLLMEPQFFPWAEQVVGVQPHTFGVPPPPHV